MNILESYTIKKYIKNFKYQTNTLFSQGYSEVLTLISIKYKNTSDFVRSI